MIRKFCSLVFCVVALLLLLAGCSSHPPSAAQFMNVKKNDGIFSVGGTAFAGDLYKPYEGGRGVLFTLSGYGRVDAFEFGLSLETTTFLPILGLRGEYLGLQGWGFFKDVEHYNEKSRTIWIGGSMLIQQYPISENFKVGLSEHISNNLMSEGNSGTFNFEDSYYSEFGIGTYLTYKGFSLEFRYGREIGEPRNRIYFMMHYAFFN